MDRRTLGFLVEAMTHYSGYLTPGSSLHLASNPIGLRPTKPEHPFDEEGNRIFNCGLDGMQGAYFDLEIKLLGRLSPDSTLTDLATAYGRKATEAQAWAKWLRSALNDPTISARTAISRFIEEQ